LRHSVTYARSLHKTKRLSIIHTDVKKVDVITIITGISVLPADVQSPKFSSERHSLTKRV